MTKNTFSLKSPMVFVDVETTGGKPDSDRITEIGIIRVENEKKVAEYQTLINPQTHIPIFIQKMTGINSLLTDNAPLFEEVKYNIKEITEGAIFIAHNAKFDYSFIQGEFIRSNDSFKAKVLCSVRLSRFLYPNYTKHNLSSIVSRFSIPVPNRHRAYDDANAVWEFFQKAKMELGEKPFELALEKIIKGPKLPYLLKQKSFDEFPDTSGIYKIFGEIINGEDAKLIYIGKSKSLRNRIYSHFTPGKGPQTDQLLANYTRSIETIQTAGDLSAQLLEVREIKKSKPFLNKALRKRNSRIFLLETTVNGYKTIRTVFESELNKENISSILAVYNSQKSLKESLYELSNTYKLCPKLLGLEKGQGACFSSQLNHCNKACIGEERHVKYNVRFSEAFAMTKIKPWPYKSAVLVNESNLLMSQTHEVDNWIHYKTITQKGDGLDSIQESYEKEFDWDIYLILKRFLLGRSKYNSLDIKLINQNSKDYSLQ